MTDPDGFISLPPGFDPAKLKVEQGERPLRTQREEITFFAAPPGAPVVEPVETPTPVVEPVETRTPLVEPVETPPHATPPTWHLLVGSTRTPVTSRLYLGRNPAAPAGDESAALLPLDDTTKSVSKTHALVEIHDDSLLVYDLDSTNGVWVTTGTATTVEVLPGRPLTIETSARIELGDFVVTVERS